jgi:hypothetical protein
MEKVLSKDKKRKGRRQGWPSRGDKRLEADETKVRTWGLDNGLWEDVDDSEDLTGISMTPDISRDGVRVDTVCITASLLEASDQDVSHFSTSRTIAHCPYQARTSSLISPHKLLTRIFNRVPQIDTPPRLFPKHHARHSRRIRDHRI